MINIFEHLDCKTHLEVGGEHAYNAEPLLVSLMNLEFDDHSNHID